MACIAIQVYTGQEFIVSQKLIRKTGMRVINPARRKLSIRNDGSTSIGFVDVLKGYVLMDVKELTESLWHQIKDTYGVIRILDGSITAEEMARIEANLYPVVEITSQTNIQEREERILRKTAIGNIIQRIKRNKVITTFPARLLNKAIEMKQNVAIHCDPVVLMKRLVRLIS